MNENEESKELKFEFYIAGVQHHQLKTCISEVEVGNMLCMTLEPTNKYDANAVRLEFVSVEQEATIMTGYVPAKISASVSAAITVTNMQCEVIELNVDEKPWKQIKVCIKEV